MSWPWVSRRAYDLLADERDRALQMCDAIRMSHERLTEHMKRIDRVEHGLSEQPRTPKAVPDPMPDELKKYIDGYDNSSVRAELRREATNRYRGGTPWDVIRREIMQSEQQDRTAP